MAVAAATAECRTVAFLSDNNGATGMSDMHGNAVRVSESEAGVERMNGATGISDMAG